MRSIMRSCWLFVAGGCLLAGATVPAVACPFCSAPSQTLSEQVAQADGVCLVAWTGGTTATDQDPGKSTYEILQVVKAPKESVAKGDRVTLARYRAGKKGDLFLLMGTKSGRGNGIDWGSPTEITESSFNYVAQAPTPEVPVSKRLTYFVRFLEFPDQLVSNDAYAEFANAPYKDIESVASKLPHEKIRQWIVRPETPQPRLGLYGMMLGLCGDNHDAQLLADKISQKTEDFRIGIDGLISGYLLLTGPTGLDHIDDWKFKDRKVPFSETYAAMMGLRFMWQYASGRIPSERLQQSMRILLDRPELADLVIADLARWNDWSVQDRLMQIYGKGDYNIPSIKRAIIRYMLASTQTKSAAVASTTVTGTASGAVGRWTRVRQSSARRLPRVCRARQAVPGPTAEAQSQDGQRGRTVLLRELNRVMVDVKAIQAAIREFGFDGWLLCDFRGSNVLAQRVLGLAPGDVGLAPLFLFDPCTGGAAKAGPPHRARGTRPRAGIEDGLSPLARTGSRFTATRRRNENGGDGVLAPQRHSVRLARRCGDSRAGAELRCRRRLVRRLDSALRGVLGRRAGAFPFRGSGPHRFRVRPRLAVDREARARDRIDRRERSAGRHPQALR